jgi:hypothetical protein
MIFKEIIDRGHEQVSYFNDPTLGLRGIVAIHNTVLGPALGGSRMWNYKSEEDALIDVLRLSKGMTYKAAIAGLNLGGGKAVIIGDPKKEKSEELFRSFGRFIDGLGGRYITAEDVGTSINLPNDLKSSSDFSFLGSPIITAFPPPKLSPAIAALYVMPFDSLSTSINASSSDL